MKYRKGFKYQVAEDEYFITDILGYDIDLKFLQLTPDGMFLTRHGYAWDGPSGPAVDSDDFMRPSLGHDGLYQLMRLELLPRSLRKQIDKLMHKWCLEEEMLEFRADYCYAGVRAFADSAADPKNKRKVYEV